MARLLSIGFDITYGYHWRDGKRRRKKREIASTRTMDDGSSKSETTGRSERNLRTRVKNSETFGLFPVVVARVSFREWPHFFFSCLPLSPKEFSLKLKIQNGYHALSITSKRLHFHRPKIIRSIIWLWMWRRTRSFRAINPRILVPHETGLLTTFSLCGLLFTMGCW